MLREQPYSDRIIVAKLTDLCNFGSFGQPGRPGDSNSPVMVAASLQKQQDMQIVLRKLNLAAYSMA